MFIDGNLSTKTQQTSTSIRSTDANSNTNNVNSTSRRKSRKSSKTLSDHLNKSSTNDDDTQSIEFLDDDHRTNPITQHSPPEQITLPDDHDESHSNTTVSSLRIFLLLLRYQMKITSQIDQNQRPF